MADSTERHERVADVLMAAAHADAELDGREQETVRTLLELATGRKLLPLEIGRRLRDFDPETFDLAATVAALDLDTDADKRHLLELVVKVHDADEVWDLAEDAFVRELAEALGLPPEAYADLVVEDIELEIAGDVIEPPPLPSES